MKNLNWKVTTMKMGQWEITLEKNQQGVSLWNVYQNIPAKKAVPPAVAIAEQRKIHGAFVTLIAAKGRVNHLRDELHRKKNKKTKR